MTLVRAVSAERWGQETLAGFFQEAGLGGKEEKQYGAGGDTFWLLLFCYFL